MQDNYKLLMHGWGTTPEQKKREKEYNHEYYLKNKEKWQKRENFWNSASDRLQKNIDTVSSRHTNVYDRHNYASNDYRQLNLQDVDRNEELKNFYKNLDKAAEESKKKQAIDDYFNRRQDEIDKRVKDEYDKWLAKNVEKVYSDPNYKELQKQQKFKIRQKILGEVSQEAEEFYEKNKSSLNKSIKTDYEKTYFNEYNKNNRENIVNKLADPKGEIAQSYLAYEKNRTPIATQEFQKWVKQGDSYLAYEKNRTPEKIEAYNKFRKWVRGEAEVQANDVISKKARESYKQITGQSNSSILAKKKRQQSMSKAMADNEVAKATANKKATNMQKARDTKTIDKLVALQDTANKNSKLAMRNVYYNETKRLQAEQDEHKNRSLSKKARDFIDGTVEVAGDKIVNKSRDFLEKLTKKKKSK